MLKHPKKQTKTPMLKERKKPLLHDDLDISARETGQVDWEYGESNDLFEENIREMDENSD